MERIVYFLTVTMRREREIIRIIVKFQLKAYFLKLVACLLV